MDDYSTKSLSESKNEWCIRFMNILTPELIQGLKSIFDEAWKLCAENDEEEKYLMTFQTFLSRVPKWNQTIIQDEVARIIERSGCLYLEDLLTCIHVIHLKILTCVRVGQKQKKVDINIPSLKDYIHKVYINIARKVYINIYLFEKNIPPLQIQKHNRELELIIRECILNTVRDNIPIDTLLRAYMDETEEQDVEVKEVEEKIPMTPEQTKAAQAHVHAQIQAQTQAQTATAVQTQAQTAAAAQTQAQTAVQIQTQDPIIAAPVIIKTNDRITFSDVDKSMDTTGNETELIVPKTEDNLKAMEQLREKNNIFSNNDDDDDDNEKIKIGFDVNLDTNDVNDITKPLFINSAPILDDIVDLT